MLHSIRINLAVGVTLVDISDLLAERLLEVLLAESSHMKVERLSQQGVAPEQKISFNSRRFPEIAKEELTLNP